MNFRLISLFVLLLIAACKKAPETQVKKEVKTPEQTPTDKRPSTFTKENTTEETINRKNSVAFLKNFGDENKETLVLFKTRLGNLKVRLYENTPLHRASFVFLAKQGYFNTVAVHRVVEDFVVQGGNSENPKTRRMRKRFDSYFVPAEFRADRKHKYGALAAARNWENNPNKRSTPFEFYFVVNKNGAHHLDGEHTVYGEVISGFDVLEKMSIEAVDSQEWPKNDIFFKVDVLN